MSISTGVAAVYERHPDAFEFPLGRLALVLRLTYRTDGCAPFATFNIEAGQIVSIITCDEITDDSRLSPEEVVRVYYHDGIGK